MVFNVNVPMVWSALKLMVATPEPGSDVIVRLLKVFLPFIVPGVAVVVVIITLLNVNPPPLNVKFEPVIGPIVDVPALKFKFSERSKDINVPEAVGLNVLPLSEIPRTKRLFDWSEWAAAL